MKDQQFERDSVLFIYIVQPRVQAAHLSLQRGRGGSKHTVTFDKNLDSNEFTHKSENGLRCQGQFDNTTTGSRLDHSSAATFSKHNCVTVQN